MTKRLRQTKRRERSKDTSSLSPRPEKWKKLRIDIPLEIGTITPVPLTFPMAASERNIDPNVHGLAAIGACAMGRYYAISVRKGYRRKMEDTFCALPCLKINPSNSFFGVFDGHGKEGKQVAMLASTQLGKCAESDLFNHDVERAFQTAFRDTDKVCLEQVDEGGTTATCVYIRGKEKRIWVANVGDSRCVLSRAGLALDLSRDQRPDRDDEKQRIEEVGGTVVYCPGHGGQGWRVEGTLNISRSLGDKKLKKFVYSEPEIHEERITDDDQFLILATDGLWNVITSQQAVDIVNKYYPACSPAEATEALSREAMMKQTTDNLCVMVMFLSSPHSIDIRLPAFISARSYQKKMDWTQDPDLVSETFINPDMSSQRLPSQCSRCIVTANENCPIRDNITSPPRRVSPPGPTKSPPFHASLPLSLPDCPSSNSPRSVPKKSPLLASQISPSTIKVFALSPSQLPPPTQKSPTNFANAPRTSPTSREWHPPPSPSPRRKPLDR